MDDSQSSDVFSDNVEYNFEVSAEAMDISSYESLVSTTKSSLSKNIENEVKKSTFSEYFSSILEDCGTCISQSLDLITGILCDTDFQLIQLCEYLENAVTILQMLSNFITTVLESVAMSCCSMKNFPYTTGRIVMAVFSHCKDSESLYGNNLKDVERQLKDLFRNCHELQLIYLTVLEKNYNFDLSKSYQIDILVDALDVNLNIGEVVQTLDVKTMAEQWKAVTVICEKYATYITDSCIFENGTKILQSMIENHITTAVQLDQEEKIIMRSLKVATFTIKILLKLCNIFKHATKKNYKHIVDSLLLIYHNNTAYLQSISIKTPQFIKLMETNVLTPADVLLKELLLDEEFIQCLLHYEIDELSKDDKLLGYIFINVSAIKLALQENSVPSKYKLLECVFRWLPHGHIWFNMGIKFQKDTKNNKTSPTTSYGLYEHLLVHTYALVSTFTTEEINSLEHMMLKAVLSTDCYSALFFTNLWELLARSSPRQITFHQLQSLYGIYQELEAIQSFCKSPQRIHLSFIMRKLHQNLDPKDKVCIYKLYDVKYKKNLSLWTILPIASLPRELRDTAEEYLSENLKMALHKVSTNNVRRPEDLESLIKSMNVCSSFIMDLELDDLLVAAWMKLCPANTVAILQRTPLLSKYFKTLVSSLTSCVHMFDDSNIVKVLHVLSKVVETANTETKLALIKLLHPLCQLDRNERNLTQSLLQIFKVLLLDNDCIVRSKTFCEISKIKHIRGIMSVSKIFSLNDIKDILKNISERSTIKDQADLKEILVATTDLKYIHKCIEVQEYIELSDSNISVPLSKKNSNNFDFADIDTLFEGDEEPASKKLKLNTSEIEEILTKLEEDAILLCNLKENVFTVEYQDRIREVCDKLNNIVN